jgi:heme-degrading monooxygenase HmoA
MDGGFRRKVREAMIAVVTEIEVRGLPGLFRFGLHLLRIRRQLRTAAGLVSVDYRPYRTLTVWHSREAMQAFRNTGAHLDAMKNVRRIGRAKSAAWEVAAIPAWEEAIGRLHSSA